MYGAKAPPILAIIEDDPTATFLTTVGYISAVNTYIILYDPVMPIFPIIAKVIESQRKSVKGQI